MIQEGDEWMSSGRECLYSLWVTVLPPYLADNENTLVDDLAQLAGVSDNWGLARRKRQPLWHASVLVWGEGASHGRLCMARLRSKQEHPVLRGSPQPSRKHLGSFANTQLSGDLMKADLALSDAALLSALCPIVFFFFFGARFVRPWGPHRLRSAGAQFTFCWKKNVSSFLFEGLC